MKVGFTGTRKGMSLTQAHSCQLVLAWLIQANKLFDAELHYGKHETVKLLADEEAARLANAIGYRLEPH